MNTRNALGLERSPYLLQHANNPVDWLPWGEPAFERARKEDKPILVSIGYSTCHWCHVMERESFEDEDIAALLNDAFVCVKVDREERPDIDATYMNVCHMLTGSGGWPLNVLITPDKKPFFAATYLPPSAKGNRLGLKELVPRIMDIWQNDRQRVTQSSEQITQALSDMDPAGESGEELNAEKLARIVHGSLTEMFDTDSGGFGKAPKFPSAQNLLFLLQRSKRHDNEEAKKMAVKTLHAMRRGGIWDHVGFGFHRYSTDRQWLLPHFEKMLYDQAMLSMTYLEGYQHTGKAEFAETARRIFTYVLRDLRDPQGGFHTAEDADSEGEEGLFHTWTMDEIRQVLSPEETEVFGRHYGIREAGNFHDEATGALTGRNIPNELESDEPTSATIESLRERLFEAREKRPRPHLDDKVLTDMNGLMIAALARGARVLHETQYEQAAREAADFVLTTLSEEGGRLRHGYRGGHLKAPGTLDDHAFFLWGLIELHTTTFDERYLESAAQIAECMIRHFEDREKGGFFLSADDGETVLTRHKDSYDGAIPCGNSVALHVLTDLGRLLERPDFEEAAKRCALAHSGILSRQPHALTHMVAGLEILQSAPRTLTIVGPKEAPETKALMATATECYCPGLLLRFLQTDASTPQTENYESELGKLNVIAGAWLCQDYHCEPPTGDPEKLRNMLGG